MPDVRQALQERMVGQSCLQEVSHFLRMEGRQHDLDGPRLLGWRPR